MLRKKEKSIRIEIGKKDMELCGKEVKHCWQVENCILLPVEVADINSIQINLQIHRSDKSPIFLCLSNKYHYSLHP